MISFTRACFSPVFSLFLVLVFPQNTSCRAGNQEICSSSILRPKVHSPKVYSPKWIMHIHLSEEHIRRHLVMCVPWYAYLFFEAPDMSMTRQRLSLSCILYMKWMPGIPRDKEEAKESFCLWWIKVAPSPPIYILTPRESFCALFHWSMAGLVMEDLLVDKTYSYTGSKHQSAL